MDRRTFVAAGCLSLLTWRHGTAAEGLTEITDLKPGQFTWHPDRQAQGPVAIIVSLPQQRVHVYRNGVRIAVSTCSSGKPGHETPTGVFVILEKDRNHKSSTYSDAPMPNMNRLTWSGIALHAGNLPGYPASHGCVRLPMAFSADLFSITHIGTPVIIAGPDDSAELTHPGWVLGGYSAGEFAQIVASKDGKKHPADWAGSESYPITSVIASSSDRQIMLIENGRVIDQAALTIAGGGSVGNHVLTLQASGADGQLQWISIGGTATAKSFLSHKADILQRLNTSKDFVAAMSQKMHPGMVLIVTDAPLHPDRRGDDFVVMAAE